MKRVLVCLAPGFEEIEALTVVDVLRRGGVEVIVGGTIEGPIEGRSGISVLADMSLDEIDAERLDMIVLPGGMPGATNLKEDLRVQDIVQSLHKRGKYIAAICAAPTVLSALGLLEGKRVTSFPSVKDQLSETDYREERVVVDGNLITSRSPGTAMEFAMKLLELLCGREVMEKVNQGVMAKLSPSD